MATLDYDPSYEDITEKLIDYLIEINAYQFDLTTVWLALKRRFNITTPFIGGKRFFDNILPDIIKGKKFLISYSDETSTFMNKKVKDTLILPIKITETWEEMGIFIPELIRSRISVIPS